MKRKRFKKFFKRLCALLTAMMILFFTGLDSFIYKPMQAYAAAVAVPAWLGGSVGSLLSDLFFSFGFGKTTFDTSSSYALSQQFYDYVEEKKGSYDTTDEEELAKLLEPIGYMSDTGKIVTYDLSAKDVVDTSNFIDKLKDSVETTVAVPKALVNTMRAFLVKELNFNAVDGTGVTTVYTMPAEKYYDIILTRFSFPLIAYDNSFYLTADKPCWGMKYSSDDGSYRFYMVSECDTVLTYHYTNGDVESVSFYGGTTTSGYMSLVFYYWSSPKAIKLPVGLSPYFSGVQISKNKFYIVNYKYATPSVDVSFADADAIIWQGNPDLEQTLANQTQAATNGTRDEYVNNTITTTNIDQVLSYNALNYILDTIAGHYGVEVDSATKDEFIASAYTDYVQGSSSEKMEQADEVMKKFVIINGTGGNNNKHFTVLDAVVSAYVTTLILKHILPEGTAAPEPETEIENIKVVQQLPEPTPDPDPGPNPDPNPNPDIDISLSGILSRLSKILDAILELPAKMVNAFKSGIESIINAITGLPEAITNSRLGQWVQSMPQALQDILGQIKTIPDALIELGKGIAAVPGAIIDFFTIDMAQVSSAYSGMSDAFKGKFSALDQVIGVLDKDYNFSDTIPVIKMGTPDVLKYAIKDDEIVVMDLTPYANVFQWCRTILSAIMWIAFAHWVMDQFDVKFHVG